MNIPNDGGWGKPEGMYPHVAGEVRTGSLSHLKALSRDVVILACLVLTATLFLGLGLLVSRQNAPSKDPLWIEQLPASELPGSVGTSTPLSPAPASAEQTVAPQPAAAAAALPTSAQTGQYVASKTGTKYYLPSCATAKRIKDENKVWFATKQQAEAAGYEPSSTCKGI